MTPDDATIETVADVLVRYREHDQYASRTNALRALGHRCPLLPASRLQAIFDDYEAIFDETIAAAENYRDTHMRVTPVRLDAHGHAIHKPTRNERITPSPSEQIDATYRAARTFILAQLRRRFPRRRKAFIETFINWAIFWHILK